MQSAGYGSAVFTFPGTATPLPSPVHSVPTGAAGMPERLHQVYLYSRNVMSKEECLSKQQGENTFKIISSSRIF